MTTSAPVRVLLDAETLDTDLLDPELRRFATELGDLWPELRPLIGTIDEEDSSELHALARAVAERGVPATAVGDDVDAQDANPLWGHVRELDALRAGWTHFTPGQKAVLNAATAYVVASPYLGRTSADDVVSAAITALLRGR